jgi:hypothetical protein
VPYKIVAAAVSLMILAVAVIRMILRSGHHDDSDHVTQTVLTRIKAEYHDLQ